MSGVFVTVTGEIDASSVRRPLQHLYRTFADRLCERLGDDLAATILCDNVVAAFARRAR